MKVTEKEELHELFSKLRVSKDEYVYNVLYEKYGNLVLKIAFSLLKNKQSSEDVKQIVFLKIWNMECKKLPKCCEASWLYTITKNETLNYIKKQENLTSLDDIYYIDNDCQNMLDKIIDKDYYNNLLLKLDKKEREVVSLKVLSNLTFKQISSILNEPCGTVQWRYYKAISTLKGFIGNLFISILGFIVFISTSKEKDVNSKYESFEKTETVLDNKTSLSQSCEDCEVVEETHQIAEATSYPDILGISSLSISFIFLIFAIIFGVILVKHQQNINKRLSK